MPTIQDGRNAINQGNPQQARLIFEAILQETPRSEEAWLGLADVLTDAEDKRLCYENVLKINKNNRTAKDGLRNLEPQANPFVELLGQKAPEDVEEVDDEEPFDPDETMTSTSAAKRSSGTQEHYSDAMVQESDGPPSYALVALGLGLSVIVFALGSGFVFVLLSSLTGS